MDKNLWHLSFEGGILEDPWNEPKEDMFVLTNSPEKAPNHPMYIEIYFEKAFQKKINGKPMMPLV